MSFYRFSLFSHLILQKSILPSPHPAFFLPRTNSLRHLLLQFAGGKSNLSRWCLHLKACGLITEMTFPTAIHSLPPLLPFVCYSSGTLVQYFQSAAAAKLLHSCPTPCDPIDGSPPGSPILGILQAKNTGMGCHFLLQCMKVKSESEVSQSCPTLGDPMDCSLPGSSVPGIFQSRVLKTRVNKENL